MNLHTRNVYDPRPWTGRLLTRCTPFARQHETVTKLRHGFFKSQSIRHAKKSATCFLSQSFGKIIEIISCGNTRRNNTWIICVFIRQYTDCLMYVDNGICTMSILMYVQCNVGFMRRLNSVNYILNWHL